MAVLHKSEVWAQLPQLCLASGNADGDRASQLQYAVEVVDSHMHLGGPALVRARAQPVTDYAIEPAGCRSRIGVAVMMV